MYARTIICLSFHQDLPPKEILIYSTNRKFITFFVILCFILQKSKYTKTEVIPCQVINIIHERVSDKEKIVNHLFLSTLKFRSNFLYKIKIKCAVGIDIRSHLTFFLPSWKERRSRISKMNENTRELFCTIYRCLSF